MNSNYQSSYLATQGDEIKQDCDFTGEEYQGWFDAYGRAIPESGRVSVITSVKENQKKYFLHVINVQPDDGGIFFCKGKKTVRMYKFFLRSKFFYDDYKHS